MYLQLETKEMWTIVAFVKEKWMMLLHCKDYKAIFSDTRKIFNASAQNANNILV